MQGCIAAAAAHGCNPAVRRPLPSAHLVRLVGGTLRHPNAQVGQGDDDARGAAVLDGSRLGMGEHAEVSSRPAQRAAPVRSQWAPTCTMMSPPIFTDCRAATGFPAASTVVGREGVQLQAR
jgi:hypothetical protein